MKKKLYLANPYGFSKQTKKLLSEFIKIFNDLNIEVFEPFERTKHILKKEGAWAYELAKSNLNDLKKCDCVFAIVNGTPPDEGVMIELGIAIALKKDIFLFRDDFRSCSDSDQYPLNLMLFLGLPKDNWEKYYFESLEDIKSNKKRFVEWAINQPNKTSTIK
ncbi:nucleoside 2-deoxyribosyltransferase [Prochlorococcus marinus XMU1419]|uniref:nucleoside 2-deoxyribosyltransferase n=1 Tax=Prochlorococcus marinus TaxID=1219 RepID=UPI001ADC8739|nr:nucleoside 2-deoxyribosyltransferase [Prochlorococcus marinus]MBO8233930.1 nucleoside 2-deoxyribosyltransferase [Prochlorococcus marinus XMU1419]MBW3077395.1 nucleoside 2-deoxyribosyltransferase [Prochlorococcus marinus str. XMU1419]